MSTTDNNPTPNQFLRLPKAAELLAVSLRTLYRIADDGHLKIVKVRRRSCIASEQLQSYMRKRMGGAAA